MTTTGSVNSFQTFPNGNNSVGSLQSLSSLTTRGGGGGTGGGNSSSQNNNTNATTATNANNTMIGKSGLLEATILSVYDLPYSDPPTHVTLMTTNGVTITAVSGPPQSRHKDKNSFRFMTTRSSSNLDDNNNNNTNVGRNGTTNGIASGNGTSVLKLAAPLRDLYKSKLIIRVVYGGGTNNSSNNSYNSQGNNNNNNNNNRTSRAMTLQAEYDIRQLRIHESKWLILNLTPETSNAVSTTTTTATSTSTNDDDNDNEVPPTIRLKLHLSGPYRPEIAALVGLCNSWFGFVDYMEGQTRKVLPVNAAVSTVTKILSIPTIPLVTVLVVASPVVAGVLMVTLPFVLPIIVVLVATTIGISGSAAFLYASTKHGREHIGGTFLAPIKESLLSSRAGQTLIYDTGPRPTPVSVLRPMLPTTMWTKLVLSLWIDLIGSSSYLLPIVGEGLDIAWAPIQTIFIMAMYDTISPNLKFISFAEELLPFTDIVPSATIGWGLEFGPSLLGQHSTPEVQQAASQVVQGIIRASSTATTTATAAAASSMRQ